MRAIIKYLAILYFSLQSIVFIYADSLSVQLIKKQLPSTGNEDTNHIKLLIQLSNEYKTTNPDSALFFIDKVLDLSHKKNWLHGLNVGYLTKGRIYYKKDNYQQALINWEKCLKIREKINDVQGIASSFAHIGQVYQKLGNYPEAIKFFFKSLTKARVSYAKDIEANTLNNIGIVYYKIADFAKSIEYYKSSVAIYRELNNKSALASGLGNIGIIYDDLADSLKDKGDLKKAYQFCIKADESYSSALKIAEEINDPYYIAVWMGNLGNIKKLMGEIIISANKNLQNGKFRNTDSLFQEAEHYYLSAVEVSEKSGELNLVTTNLGNLGSLFIIRKENRKAENYLTKALLIADSIGFTEARKNWNEKLSDLFSINENWKDAFTFLKSFARLNDSLFNEDKNTAIGNYEAKHEFTMAEIKRKNEEFLKIKRDTEEKSRKNTMQYSIILVVLIILFSFTFYITKIYLPEWVFAISFFISTLLFFEFVLLFAEPYIERITGNTPFWNLLLNSVLALLIIPFHQYWEKKWRKRFIVLSEQIKSIKTPTAMNGVAGILMFIIFFTFSGFELNKSDSLLKISKNRINYNKISANDTVLIDEITDEIIRIQSNNPNAALLLGRQALWVSLKLPEDSKKMMVEKQKNIALSVHAIGTIYFLTHELDSARYYYDKELKIREKLNDKKGIAIAKANLGNIFNEMGHLTNALNNYMESVRILESINNIERIPSILGNIGVIYFQQGNYPKSLEYQLRALKILERAKDSLKIPFTMRNIATLYYYLNNVQKAKEIALKSLKMDEKSGDKRGIAGSLEIIATIEESTGDLEKVIEIQKKILDLRKQTGDKSNVSGSYGNIGALYIDLGDSIKSKDTAQSNRLYSMGYEYYANALKIAKEINDKKEIARHLINMGILFSKTEKFKESENCFHQVTSLIDSLGHLGYKLQFEEAFSELYEKMNNYKMAYSHFKEYLKAKDSIFSDDRNREIGKLETMYELEMEEYRKELKEEQIKKAEVEKKLHENHLQYGFSFVFIIILFFIILFSGYFKIPLNFMNGMVSFSLLILFQYVLLLSELYTYNLTQDEPFFKLVINSVLAALIFPAEIFIKKKISKRYKT